MTELAPKRTHLFIGLATILLLAAVFVRLQSGDQPAAKTQIGNEYFYLERADSVTEHTKGLSGRDTLAHNGGMVFVFDYASKYCFWMKDTFVPLDIIWLGENQKIVDTKHNMTPESYPTQFCPNQNALYAIELPVGSIEKTGVKVGDQLAL